MKDHKANFAELEALSAYLDGQLSKQEAAAIRARLEADAAFREQLDALRQTRHTLRKTPKIKRPRSFVLSPEMVRRQKVAVFGMNFSRIISAAASVLLITVLGGQFLLGGGGLGAPSEAMDVAYDNAAEPQMQIADEPAEAMEMEAPMADAPMDDAPMAEGDAVGAADEEPAEESAAEEEPPMAAVAPTLAGTPEPGGGGGASPEDAEEPMVQATATVGNAGETRSVPNQKDTPEDGLAPESPVENGEIAALEITQEAETVLADPPPDVQPRFSLSPSGIIQTVLLILAIGGGILAAYFRKRVR